MTRICFSCGAELPMNSIKCQECGYRPDEELARVCPNKKMGKCILKGTLCDYVKAYQTCPTKNNADSHCGY